MEGVSDIELAMVEVRGVLGEIPIQAAGGNSAAEEAEEDGAATGQSGGTRSKVLAGGTYATESAYTMSAPVSVSTSKSKHPLRGTSISKMRLGC